MASEPVKNRLLDLLTATTLNGIDYVEVREAEPDRLYVHMLNRVDVAEPRLEATISGGDRIPSVAVELIQSTDWTRDPEGRPILQLRLPERGDFSKYKLRISGGSKLDPYFREARFSFYAFCPSPADCRPDAVFCPADDAYLPPIDLLSKDFGSFRKALSDFSALRFPEWRERAEADLGVVMLEALSAIGDDLSYLQDRVHQEAFIETASERRSLVRLARLVDYEPKPAASARTLLHCRVAAILLPAGILVIGQAADGSEVSFEIGTGLRDTKEYPVNPAWNEIEPYWWTDEDRCLGVGATSMDLQEHGYGFVRGLLLLVDTAGPTPADPPARELVRLINAEEMTDPLYGKPLTRITWTTEDALERHHDLTRTTVKGNLVPATQGRRRVETFAIGQAPAFAPAMPLAVERLGPNSTANEPRWQALYTLAAHPMAYLMNSDTDAIEPELILTRSGDVPRPWRWVRRFIDAGPFEETFTLESAAWQPVMRTPDGIAYDYDGLDGTTIRFGDGVFGELPNDGDVFEVRYRVGNGAAGNLAADTIAAVDPIWRSVLLEASNPFPAEGGDDGETDEQIRQRAPFAFRSTVYRAVSAADYEDAVSQLPWVQRAGIRFRWTGSWPTVFATADPRGSGEIGPAQHLELVQLLNRYRLAGYECHAPPPNYVSFDIQIVVCANADAFRGDVHTALNRVLSPVRYPDGTLGFFHFDNFTLRTPFERSRLEAAIQSAPGVAGIRSIQYRRRGQLNTFVEMPARVVFAPGEIFRLDNNPSRPERGSFRVQVEGGK